MRQDIQDLLNTRPIWQLLNDPVYKDLIAARDIAQSEHDRQTVETLDEMIEEYKKTWRKP